MHLSDFISPDSVLPSLRVKSKKQLLQELSSRAARRTGLPERVIFDVLLQRERLGSTGLGQGIAIPHGKIPGLKSISRLLREGSAVEKLRASRDAAALYAMLTESETSSSHAA
jgi:PTS system nitrogen regulatory IIA component